MLFRSYVSIQTTSAAVPHARAFPRRLTIALPLVALLLTACAATTGWVSKDSAKGTGVYVWSNGQRYEGQMANDEFHGVGTLVYPENLPWEVERDRIDWPRVLRGSALTLIWSNGKYSANNAKFVNKALTYEGGWSGGTKGPGVLTLKDGRRLEGAFSNEPTLYDWYGPRRGETVFRFDTDSVIGSKLSGQVRVSWPDGSQFEGMLLDYNLFSRGIATEWCVTPRIIGVGRLTVPGKAEYVGPIVELANRPRPAQISELEEYAGELAECRPKLAAERDRLLDFARKYDAEMTQARREAKAWLHNEIAKMPAQKAREMASVEMASRGTTPQIEAEKARRNAEMQAALEKVRAESPPLSSSSSSSSTTRAVHNCEYYINENAFPPGLTPEKREAARREAAESNARLRERGVPPCEVNKPTGPSRNSSK